jgi:hypothetical protein
MVAAAVLGMLPLAASAQVTWGASANNGYATGSVEYDGSAEFWEAGTPSINNGGDYQLGDAIRGYSYYDLPGTPALIEDLSVGAGVGTQYATGAYGVATTLASHVAQLSVTSLQGYSADFWVYSSTTGQYQGGATATFTFDGWHSSAYSDSVLALAQSPSNPAYVDSKYRTETGVLYPGRSYGLSASANAGAFGISSGNPSEEVASDAFSYWSITLGGVSNLSTFVPVPSTTNWGSSGSWTSGIPNASCAFAYFPEASSATTVTVNSTYTVGRLGINSNAAYTFSGSGSIDLNCTKAHIDVIKGNHVISVPVSFSANTTITVDPNASLRLASGLSVPAGKTVDIAYGGSLIATSVSVTSTGKLDVGDQALVVDYTGSSPVSSIRSLIIGGLNSGTWDGPGINSWYAALDAMNRAVGYAEAGTVGITSWRGQSVDATTIIIDLTIMGDANLDGIVDSADQSILTANLSGTSKHWYQGDFNYDGVVNSADQSILSAHLGLSLLIASVPEPTSFLIVAGAGLLALRRRAGGRRM